MTIPEIRRASKRHVLEEIINPITINDTVGIQPVSRAYHCTINTGHDVQEYTLCWH